MLPGLYSVPGAMCAVSSLLVLALLRGFFTGFFGFPFSTKNNILDQHRGPALKPTKADVASSLIIVVY